VLRLYLCLCFYFWAYSWSAFRFLKRLLLACLLGGVGYECLFAGVVMLSYCFILSLLSLVGGEISVNVAEALFFFVVPWLRCWLFFFFVFF